MSHQPRTRFGALNLTAALFVCLLIAGTAPLAAYERYNGGCQNCHGNYTESNYTSQATDQPWPSSLHTVHRSSSYMNTDCDLCHRSDDSGNPFLNSSDGTGNNVGYGCVGCHGGAVAGGTPTGDVLRRHHVNAGAAGCFQSCHSPGAVPEQELTQPVYYGSADSNVASSCNADMSTSEDWNDDGQGLDNDGDLLYDGDDPACWDGFIFHDNFVTGDIQTWAAVVPSPPAAASPFDDESSTNDQQLR